MMSHKTFSQEKQEIRDEILLLSSMVEQAVMNSAEALKNNNLELARRIILEDSSINQKHLENEISIMVLMATHQPIAHDLRMLAASLFICTELERMGDYAKGIATISLRSEGLGLPHIQRAIYAMAEKAVDMLHRAMTAFAEENIQSAKAIVLEDGRIDEYYSRLYSEAIKGVLGDPGSIERANYVIWVAHNLERLADRVTNICERVIYIVTGERLEANDLRDEAKLSIQLLNAEYVH